MEITETSLLTEPEREHLCALWNREYPVQLSYDTLAAFDNYLAGLGNSLHYLLKNEAGDIMGWACKFIRDNEKWFAIILDGRVQGKGMGTLLLEQLKKEEDWLSGWATDHDRYIKPDGEPYRSPLQFYEKNGFSMAFEEDIDIDNGFLMNDYVMEKDLEKNG